MSTSSKVKMFQDKIGTSLYLNSKDIDDKGIIIRPLPWIYQNQLVRYLIHLEGWEDTTKGNQKSQRPVRFELEDDIPELHWTHGVYNGKPTSGAPKPAMAMLVGVNDTIKVASFSQATICRPFAAFMDDEDQVNFIPDLTECDFILKKGNDNKFSVSVKPHCKPEIPSVYLSALDAFAFSWKAYMQGLDPFDAANDLHTFEEVKVLLSGKKPTQTKKAQVKEEEKYPEWRKFKTAKGTLLGNLNLDQLMELQAFMADKGKQDAPLCKNVEYGIIHFEDEAVELAPLEDSDIPF